MAAAAKVRFDACMGWPAALLGCFVASIGCSAADAPRAKELDPDVAPVTEGPWLRPSTTTTWQWQLLGEVNTGYDVDLYDIDLFDSSAELIAALRAAGRIVVCYFSAGSYEDFRSDAGDFPDNVLGDALDDWEGERWLDIRAQAVVDIMRTRLDLAVTKGCDGVEPDNVDGFDNSTGFDLAARDQLAFNKWIANEAHRRNLAVGLKNDGDQAAALLEYYDFSLNEQCHEFTECAQLSGFTAVGKPVFNAEYPSDAVAATALATKVCPEAQAENFRTLLLPLDLDDAFRVTCEP